MSRVSLHDYTSAVFAEIGIACRTEDDLNALISLTESLIANSDLNLSVLMDGFCKARAMQRKVLDRIIDCGFDVYNADRLYKIKAFTQTDPITNKDALCDVALTISKNLCVPEYL